MMAPGQRILHRYKSMSLNQKSVLQFIFAKEQV
jgi:hypothetical protein